MSKFFFKKIGHPHSDPPWVGRVSPMRVVVANPNASVPKGQRAEDSQPYPEIHVEGIMS